MQYCPHPELQRSRRRWHEVPRSWLFRMQPYRCALCHRRLWRYSGLWYRDLAILLVAVTLAWWWFAESDQADPLVLAQTPNVSIAARDPAPETQSVVAVTPMPAAEKSTVVGKKERALGLSPVPRLAQKAAAAAAPAASARRVVVRPVPTKQAKATPRPKQKKVKSSGNVLLDAQVISDDGRFQLKLKYSGAMPNPRLFRLQGPPRLVLDIPGEWSIRSGQLQTVKGDSLFVQKIRFGKHEKNMRVVLDLNVEISGVKPLVIKREGAILLRLSR